MQRIKVDTRSQCRMLRLFQDEWRSGEWKVLSVIRAKGFSVRSATCPTCTALRPLSGSPCPDDASSVLQDAVSIPAASTILFPTLPLQNPHKPLHFKILRKRARHRSRHFPITSLAPLHAFCVQQACNRVFFWLVLRRLPRYGLIYLLPFVGRFRGGMIFHKRPAASLSGL